MRPDRPMLATPSTGSSNRSPIDITSLRNTHAFDLKMDGIRAFAQYDGSTLVLINRNGVDITWKFPEIVASWTHDLPLWLDGEIVCDSGRFEDTLTRDKQGTKAAVAAQVTARPASFHAFDLPAYHALPWFERRDYLEDLEMPGARFQITPCESDPEFLDRTRAAGLEGVIAKRLDALYQFGARSKAWVKFKNLHRVTCLVAGYEPGTGARAHFGHMNLALVDGAGQVVSCGAVGTGFSNAEILDLKARLDAGEVLVVEIECLNRTSGGTLRFPVYKGIRSDVDVFACSTDQLDTLPAC